MNTDHDIGYTETPYPEPVVWPTVQEQIKYWNRIERLEHERVMNIRDESRYATNETRDSVFCELCKMNVWKTRIEHHRTWCNPRLATSQIPDGNASTTAKTLTQEEIEEREQASCEIYDEREREWRDDGRNPDGTGESYAERNL